MIKVDLVSGVRQMYFRTAMNTEMPKLVKQRTIVQNQGEIMRAILAHKFMVIE